MDKNRLRSVLCYVAAAAFYIAAVLAFVRGDNTMGIVQLCLGSTFLCLGSVRFGGGRPQDK